MYYRQTFCQQINIGQNDTRSRFRSLESLGDRYSET